MLCYMSVTMSTNSLTIYIQSFHLVCYLLRDRHWYPTPISTGRNFVEMYIPSSSFCKLCTNLCKPPAIWIVANTNVVTTRGKNSQRICTWIECNFEKIMLTTDFNFLYWRLTRKICSLILLNGCECMPSKCMYKIMLPNRYTVHIRAHFPRLMYWEVTNGKNPARNQLSDKSGNSPPC